MVQDGDEPIGYASVVLNQKQQVLTDEKGYFQFSLSLNEGKDSLDISVNALGYLPFFLTISMQQVKSPLSIRMIRSSRVLDRVVVTAGRREESIKTATVSTEIISPYLIQNRNTTNMEKLVDQVPGLSVIDGQANIRGGSGWSYGTGSRVLVLLDGMPFISGDAGSVQWKFLPIENVSQVEVVKGASSVLYGSSALNGIIHFKTLQPGNKPLTQVALFSGLYSDAERSTLKWNRDALWNSGFSVFHARRLKLNTFSGSVFYVKDDGYRLGENDHRIRGNFSSTFRSVKRPLLTYGLNGGIMYSRTQSFLLWENYTYGYTALDSQATETNSGNFYIDPHLQFYSAGIRHSFKGRWMHVYNMVNTPDPKVNQDNAFYFLFGDYQLQKGFLNQKLTFILGATGQYTESNSPLFQGFRTSSNAAAYLQTDCKVTRRFTLSAGMRYEKNTISGAEASKPVKRMGLNYELTRFTFLRASYGEGFRFPSIGEKFIRTRVGSLSIFPNPNLEPETGFNAELGLKQGFRIDKVYGFVDVAYFHTEFQNMIEFNFGFWQGLTDVGFKSLNVGDTRISGWDISVGAEGETGKIKLQFLGGYTYMIPVSLSPDKTIVTDFFGNKMSYIKTSSNPTADHVLKYRYRHIAKADLQATYAGFSYGLGFRFNSFMENVDAVFVSAIPGVAESRNMNRNGDWIWDTRLAYSLNKVIKLNLVVSNIFNHEMQTRPADLRPPRLMNLQAQLKW